MRRHTLNPEEVYTTLARRRCLDCITLWPEWAWAIDLPTEAAKRIENRGSEPWRRFLPPNGALLAIHAGAYIGGRKGAPATDEGLRSVAGMAEAAGFSVRYFADYGGSNRVYGIDVFDCLGQRGFITFEPPGGLTRAVRPIVTSAIVGLARLTRTWAPGVWETNRDLRATGGVFGWKVPDAWGWQFDYLSLREPVPCKGAQGIWQADRDTFAAVLSRVRP